MTLPIVIEDIIMDYHAQLVLTEKWDRVVKDIKRMRRFAGHYTNFDEQYELFFQALWCMNGGGTRPRLYIPS